MQRIRPQLDDKILLGWNALMITACCKAFAALGEENYRDMALRCMHFLEEKMKGKGLYHFYHCYTGKKKVTDVETIGNEGNTKSTIPAFLDDYAYLIEAYIQLQEVTGKPDWLFRAKELTEFVVKHFSEEDSGYFYYTHAGQDDVIVRKREVYDGAHAIGKFGYGRKFVISGDGI